MFRVIFYDRKNQRKVYLDELMPINLVNQTVVVQEERDLKNGTFYSQDVVTGDIGYKVGKGKHTNWDHYCMKTDLIFLGMEWIEDDNDE